MEKVKANSLVGEVGTELYDQISEFIENPTAGKIQKLISAYPSTSAESYEPDLELIISKSENQLENIDPESDLMTWLACHSNLAFSALATKDYDKVRNCIRSLKGILDNSQVQNNQQLKDTVEELVTEIQSLLK